MCYLRAHDVVSMTWVGGGLLETVFQTEKAKPQNRRVHGLLRRREQGVQVGAAGSDSTKEEALGGLWGGGQGRT